MGIGLPLRPAIGEQRAALQHPDGQVPGQQQRPEQGQGHIQPAALEPQSRQGGKCQGHQGKAEARQQRTVLERGRCQRQPTQ